MTKREDMEDDFPDNVRKRKVKIDEDDPTVLMMHALIAARDAFNAYIERDGTDPAYFDLRLTAWRLSMDNFQRLERVELEHEVKEKP